MRIRRYLLYLLSALVYPVATMALVCASCLLPGTRCELGIDAAPIEAVLLIFIGLLVVGALIVLAIMSPLFYMMQRSGHSNLATFLAASLCVGMAPILLPCVAGGTCPRQWAIYISCGVAGLLTGSVFWIVEK